jgi:hypothetical protein
MNVKYRNSINVGTLYGSSAGYDSGGQDMIFFLKFREIIYRFLGLFCLYNIFNLKLLFWFVSHESNMSALLADTRSCMNPTPLPSVSPLTVAAYVIAGGLQIRVLYIRSNEN